MKTSQLVVKGSNLKSLIGAVKECLARKLYGGNVHAFSSLSDNVVVIAGETLYLWTHSNVLSTVILDFSHEDTCYVDIVCGGGAGFGWGAVGRSHKVLLQFIQDYCSENSWLLEDVVTISS